MRTREDRGERKEDRQAPTRVRARLGYPLSSILYLLSSILLCFAPRSNAAQLLINIGTNANDGTGDTLRQAFAKVNTNFTSLFSSNPIVIGKSVWVATNGNNSTALRERMDRPFADPRAARAAATNGDTIFVLPGTHPNATNLLKNGVNWHRFPGARFEGVDVHGSPGYGIWDDRFTGAVTSNITGGEDYMRAASNDTSNLSLWGTVVVTNPATELTIDSRRIEGTFMELNVAAIVNVRNCRRVIIRADEIIDPWPRNTYYFDDGGFTQLAASTTGIYWEHGELHTHVPRIWTSGYALYGNDNPAATSLQNWWHRGDVLDNELGAGAVGTPRTAIYMVGQSAFWKY